MLWLGVGPHAVETVFTVTVQWAPGFTDLTPVTHLHSSRCEPSLLPPLASFGGYVKSLSQNTRETGETVWFCVLLFSFAFLFSRASCAAWAMPVGRVPRLRPAHVHA